jgi:hypothetical protein
MMAIYHGCFGTDILIPGACFAMVRLYGMRSVELPFENEWWIFHSMFPCMIGHKILSRLDQSNTFYPLYSSPNLI